MSDFEEQLKDHLLKYHLRDLQHDAEIVKLTGQNESLWDDVERLQGALQPFATAYERAGKSDVWSSAHLNNSAFKTAYDAVQPGQPDD